MMPHSNSLKFWAFDALDSTVIFCSKYLNSASLISVSLSFTTVMPLLGKEDGGFLK